MILKCRVLEFLQDVPYFQIKKGDKFVEMFNQEGYFQPLREDFAGDNGIGLPLMADGRDLCELQITKIVGTMYKMETKHYQHVKKAIQKKLSELNLEINRLVAKRSHLDMLIQEVEI